VPIAARPRLAVLASVAALAAALLSGCGQATTQGAAAQTVAVDLQPPTAQVRPGATQPFSAAVTGSANAAVTWSVREPAGGAVSQAGLYTAPASTGTFHVVVTSAADPAVSATATVTVTATPVVAVSLSPTTASVAAGATRQFTATVTGTSNLAVNWSVQEAGGGTVSASGLYTAPATAGTYHVKATSAADGTKVATATVTVTPPVVAGACQPLGLEAGVSVTAGVPSKSGYKSDRFSWWDAGCLKRTAALVRNDATDPFGDTGGYLLTYSYVVDGATRAVGPMPYGEYAGWGYTVNHYGTGTANAHSWSQTGTWRTVFQGAYHAVHEFKFTVQPAGGPIDITIWWTFATGKNHPLVALTHDTSRAGPNAVDADARGPYGELAFDGTTSVGTVGGVEWGDRYKFIPAAASRLVTKTAWTYNTPNVIPYTNMWMEAVDAEMGEVQSQTWTAHVAGSDYGPGQSASCSGSTSANPGSQCYLWDGANSLPANNLWPFQMNNWNLNTGTAGTTTTRMAWGQTLGSVGQQSLSAWGKTLSGYPYQSYALYAVFGKHSAGTTAAQVREMEAVSRATLTATAGTVVQDGPGGAGRTDAVAYAPKGWDHVLGAWAITAASNQATVRLAPAAGDSLPNPVFRLLGWTGSALPTSVTLDGTALVAGTDYYPSLDAATGALWLTLKRTLTTSAELSVR